MGRTKTSSTATKRQLNGTQNGWRKSPVFCLPSRHKKYQPCEPLCAFSVRGAPAPAAQPSPAGGPSCLASLGVPPAVPDCDRGRLLRGRRAPAPAGSFCVSSPLQECASGGRSGAAGPLPLLGAFVSVHHCRNVPPAVAPGPRGPRREASGCILLAMRVSLCAYANPLWPHRLAE
jgi:hypothetical protein